MSTASSKNQWLVLGGLILLCLFWADLLVRLLLTAFQAP